MACSLEAGTNLKFLFQLFIELEGVEFVLNGLVKIEIF